MLKRIHRLRRRSDIDRVYKRGRGFKSANLNLRLMPNQLGRARIAVVIGKKVSKSAVVRNRLRRRLAGQLRRQANVLASGYDILISGYSGLEQLTANQLTAELNDCLKRAGLA